MYICITHNTQCIVYIYRSPKDRYLSCGKGKTLFPLFDSGNKSPVQYVRCHSHAHCSLSDCMLHVCSSGQGVAEFKLVELLE